MKHLKTYQQLNESNSFNIQSILEEFAKGIDAKKLASLVIPNKNLLMPYYNKYVKDGVIDAGLIHSDFSKLNFKANESWYDEDYADNEDNHPVLRFLYKFFVRWPKNFIVGVWDLFRDMVIDTWEDSKFISILAGAMWILVGALVYVLGYYTYSCVEHEMNGLDKGKVQTEEFRPGHYEMHTHVINTGKSTMTYTTNDWVPDTWFIEVVGENGRKEIWYTYNGSIGKSVEKGQEVYNDDNWNWGETESK